VDDCRGSEGEINQNQENSSKFWEFEYSNTANQRHVSLPGSLTLVDL
jgi:hypothetical protein